MDMITAGDLSADALRRMALDEDLKTRVMADPLLAAIARRVARRYVAGEQLDDAVDRARGIAAAGHLVSIEYVGESIRDEPVANAATERFLEVVERIRREGLPSSVSLDLTHVGSAVDPELGRTNAARIAAAAAAAGLTMTVSAEGSQRTDLILDTYGELAAEFGATVGITLQARLHRTAEDLERVLELPGRIRLVKGAFGEPESAAVPRGSRDLSERYLSGAGRLITAGHPVSIATHDRELLAALQAKHDDVLRGPHVEFEMLLGLGRETLDGLRESGHRTREYVVFGQEWWLYVLNRISEQPERLHLALAEAVAGP